MRKDFIDQNDLERSFQRKLGNTKLQLATEESNFFKAKVRSFQKEDEKKTKQTIICETQVKKAKALARREPRRKFKLRRA